MDSVQNFAEKFNQVAMIPLKYLDNNYVTAILFLIFVLYGSLIAPALPRKVLSVFDNVFVKLIFIFLIVNFYASNPAISLFLAVIFLILISVLQQMKSLEAFTFGNALNGAPLSDVFPDKTQVMQGLTQVQSTVSQQPQIQQEMSKIAGQLQQIAQQNNMQNATTAEIVQQLYNVSGNNENQWKQYGNFNSGQMGSDNANIPVWNGTPTETSTQTSGWKVDGYSDFDSSGKIGDGSGATRYGDFGSVNAGDPITNTNPVPDNMSGCLSKDEDRQIDISKVKPFSNEYTNMDLLAEAVDPNTL